MKENKNLGHIISKNGIRMDPKKLKILQEWPHPANLQDLCSFIGMCLYYKLFIEVFSIIVHYAILQRIRLSFNGQQERMMPSMNLRRG